jgi:hypothetical protein
MRLPWVKGKRIKVKGKTDNGEKLWCLKPFAF